MDKIFKEMSLYNRNYDGNFYAIATNYRNKNGERRVKYYKKPKSEKSKIWVKDVLDCSKFKDYAQAITYIEKTYDCELEYVSNDADISTYDYMICHVAAEDGLPVRFSYLNFKTKNSSKYKNYPHTVTNIINNDPVAYIHDKQECNLPPIPLGPALELNIDTKDNVPSVDNIPMPGAVKDDSLNNKRVYEYYVIKLDTNEYFLCFTDPGFDTTASLDNAWKSSEFESAYNHMRCLNPNEIIGYCENDDPDALYMIEKIRQYPSGDVFVVDSKTYKIITR